MCAYNLKINGKGKVRFGRLQLGGILATNQHIPMAVVKSPAVMCNWLLQMLSLMFYLRLE